MSEVEKLRKEIERIKERNRRVERDKTWETSWTRRIAISITTYILIAIFLWVIKVEKPFMAAIIPSVAYLISTATLGFLKDRWLGQGK